MAKTQKNLRISGLTERQLEELSDTMEMSDTEAITVAVDRLYRDLCSKNADVMESVRYFTGRVHKMEDAPVDKWPQWTGEDIMQIEELLIALSKA